MFRACNKTLPQIRSGVSVPQDTRIVSGWPVIRLVANSILTEIATEACRMLPP
jgi:hypothetical protein